MRKKSGMTRTTMTKVRTTTFSIRQAEAARPDLLQESSDGRLQMKKRGRIPAIVILVLLFAGADNDIRTKYVGQSNCLPELKSADHYGIRLDKSQMAYLDAYQWDGKNTLAIVQHNQSDDSCGTIRDIVQSRDPHSSFIFECKDNSADVVVGAWPETHQSASGLATEAWKIDLKDLK